MKYEVGCEGYQATCEHATAKHCGTFEAESWDEAINKYKLSLSADQHKYFHKSACGWTFWACRFFDNEADARKAYG